MEKRWTLALALVLAACSGGQGGIDNNQASTVATVAPTPVARPATTEVAQAIPTEAATVKEVYDGTTGAPVVVIEESHGTRTGQLETALVLSQLHDQFGLKHIVLEGLLKGESQLDRQVYRPWSSRSPADRARYAANLVRRGDIGGAEFAVTVYDDVVALPAETAADYSSDMRIDGPVVLTLYLGQVALPSLDQETLAEVQAFGEKVAEESSDVTDPQARQLLNGLKIAEHVASLDPWSKDQLAKYRDEHTRSIEEEIALIEGVVQRGKDKQAMIEGTLQSALDNYLEFLNKRSHASVTIVETAGGIADAPDVAIVAANIGAGHTDRVCKLLKAAGRPYVLVSLNSLNAKDDEGEMSLADLGRKYNQEPVGEGLLRQDLLDIYPVRQVEVHNKPRPVVQQEWFQAKAELYASAQGLADVLRPGAGGNGGKPPDVTGWLSAANGGDDGDDGGDSWRLVVVPPDDSRRKELEQNRFVHVNLDTVEVHSQGGKPVELLFEAVLQNENGEERSMWVKAGLVEHLNPDEPSATVEDVLKREISETKETKSEPAAEETADVAHVQISLDTKVIIAATREGAIQTAIRY